MAQQNVELIASRTLSTSGGRVSASRTYHVWDDASPISEPNDIVYGGADLLPARGESFLSTPGVYCVAYTIEPVARSNDVWLVRCEYSSGGGGVVTPPAEVGYVQFTFSYGGIFRDIYRTGSLAFQSGTPSVLADIGGTPADAGGSPTSAFIPQQRIHVEETVSAASLVTVTAAMRAAIGKRNADTFYGISTIGKVLYEGGEASRVSLDAYTISHRFLFDNDYHMVQAARMNALGNVDIGSVGGVMAARHVRFVQPFLPTTPFTGAIGVYW